jgi:type IV pilus assembly protein PilB
VTLSGQHLFESGFDVPDGFDAFEPNGCVRCGGTGYRGRGGIYEVMIVDEGMRKLILDSASADDLRAAARMGGMRSLREAGLDNVRTGMTSVAEVLRVTGSVS